MYVYIWFVNQSSYDERHHHVVTSHDPKNMLQTLIWSVQTKLENILQIEHQKHRADLQIFCTLQTFTLQTFMNTSCRHYFYTLQTLFRIRTDNV